MRKTIVCAALLTALAAPPAFAQSSVELVGQLLAEFDKMAKEKGFSRDPAIVNADGFTGQLPKGGSVTLQVNMRAGAEYIIVGVCDLNCEDLDTRLSTPDGRTKLTEDVLDDDSPLMQIKASESGGYLLTVVMASCKTDRCYFGVKAASK